MLLAAKEAQQNAVAGILDKSKVATYFSTYLIMVALTAILTAGANLVLEAIVLIVMWDYNRRYDGRDFIDRVAVVSAGPLIRINIWSVVLLFAAFIGGLTLYTLGILIAGVFYHTRRIVCFRQMIDSRVRPFRKAFEDHDEVSALETEVEELQRLKADRERATQLRNQVSQLKGEIDGVKELSGGLDSEPQSLKPTSQNTAARLTALRDIVKAHKLRTSGVLSDDEFRLRKTDILTRFDWSSVEVSPEDALIEIMELRDKGIVDHDDVQWVKGVLISRD